MTSQVRSRQEGLQAPLAAVNGITPSRVWLPQGDWPSMGAFLRQRFQFVQESDLRLRVERGDIVDSQGQAVHFDQPYQANQWLWYFRQVANEVAVPFDMPVLYADDHLIAVDKPHFLASTPGGQYLQHTALTRVRHLFNEPLITPLHRLDRETAGVLLFCRQPALRGAYQSLFAAQAVDKTYEAIARSNDQLESPLTYRSFIASRKGQFLVQEQSAPAPNSETHIEQHVRWQDPDHGSLSHYVLQPVTGRKHQLRVHLHALGTPIVNDSYYPPGQTPLAPEDFTKPLQLLARSIGFIDPQTKQYRQFQSLRTLALLPSVKKTCEN